MLQPFLPYSLTASSFPFRHLAMLAGRAPIGGAREVALGCFVAARLAAERGRSGTEPGNGAHEARATAARSWLGTLTLPATVRAPLTQCIESSAGRSTAQLAREVTAVRRACASYLDVGSCAELDALADALVDTNDSSLPTGASEP